MSSTLLINASPHGTDSRGYRLARQAAANLLTRETDGQLVERDLATLTASALPRGYAEAIVGRQGPEAEVFALSEELIRELERTTLLIIATPMHNFTVPASLKLWIDYVLRYGRSFAPQGGRKVGLLKDRPTLVVVTSGGLVTGPVASQPDHLTAYLTDVLATIGIKDVRFVYLEGLVRPDLAEQMLALGWQTISADPAFGTPIVA